MATAKRSPARGHSTAKKSTKSSSTSARKRAGLKTGMQAKPTRKKVTSSRTRTAEKSATSPRGESQRGGLIKRAIKKGISELTKAGS